MQPHARKGVATGKDGAGEREDEGAVSSGAGGGGRRKAEKAEGEIEPEAAGAAGKGGEGQEGAAGSGPFLARLITVGKKRLPSAARHERFYGFVCECASHMEASLSVAVAIEARGVTRVLA